MEGLRLKFRFDLGYLHRRGEPGTELGHGFLGRPCRRDRSKPEIDLRFLVAGLGEGRHVRQRRDPGPCAGRQRAQTAGFQMFSCLCIANDRCRHMISQQCVHRRRRA